MQQSKPVFKCHASAIGLIITDPRTKSEMLSKTAITHLEEWMNEHLYERRQSFSSKYTDKGNECEDDSIEFASRVYGWGSDVKKNTVTKENEWFIGTCDVDRGKIGADIKNSWSEKTFPLWHKSIPGKGYYGQLQVYADLYGFEQLELIYTLMDAPEHLIEQEARKQQRILRLDDLELELYEEVRAKMTYSHLPDFLRIKKFEFEMDEAFILKARWRVELCRKWIETETDFYKKLEMKING